MNCDVKLYLNQISEISYINKGTSKDRATQLLNVRPVSHVGLNSFRTFNKGKGKLLLFSPIASPI